MRQARCLASNVLENVVEEGVHDSHGLGRDAGVRHLVCLYASGGLFHTFSTSSNPAFPMTSSSLSVNHLASLKNRNSHGYAHLPAFTVNAWSPSPSYLLPVTRYGVAMLPSKAKPSPSALDLFHSCSRSSFLHRLLFLLHHHFPLPPGSSLSAYKHAGISLILK